MISYLFKIMPRSVKNLINRLYLLPWAIVDPKWFWFFELMLENAHVPKKYRYMFCPKDDNAVFIDCGANVWLITDIARFMDMEVYAFEPSPQAIKLLNKKYKNDEKVHLYPNAVSNKNWKMDFLSNESDLFDQSATIIKECAEIEWWKNNKVEVNILRLSEVIKNDILPKHKRIHLLKLDIEWAEFDVINDIIDENIYKDINYIVVETHERFFKNWKSMLKEVKRKIQDKNINNIFLDWI